MPNILHSDVLPGLASLPREHFHCAMTSPPYWRLREYEGVAPTLWADGQEVCLGSEDDPDSFIRHLVQVFAALRLTLRHDGVLFVNIGETYATGKGRCRNPGGGEYSLDKHKKAAGVIPLNRMNVSDVRRIGLRHGDRCGIPERFVLAMQADDWIWRDTIIWCKKSPMPTSQFGWRWVKCKTPGCEKCRDSDGWILRKGKFRTTPAHEPVFMFSKSERYFLDDRAAAEPATCRAPGNKSLDKMARYKTNDAYSRIHRGKITGTLNAAVEQRNPRSWWPLSNEPLKENHFAAYPSALVKKCLDMATSKGGCCANCGSPYAPMIETARIPTRTGAASKTTGDSQREGNRDPQRHVTVTRTLGYRATCSCPTQEPTPCRVLDPFLGSGTTGRVANHLALDWTGIEASAEYIEIAQRNTLRPLTPSKTTQSKPQPNDLTQLNLFA